MVVSCCKRAICTYYNILSFLDWHIARWPNRTVTVEMCSKVGVQGVSVLNRNYTGVLTRVGQVSLVTIPLILYHRLLSSVCCACGKLFPHARSHLTTRENTPCHRTVGRVAGALRSSCQEKTPCYTSCSFYSYLFTSREYRCSVLSPRRLLF